MELRPPNRCSMNWLLLESSAGDHAWNMALDEALLESSAQLGKPVLRFYSWTEPAASFGYFQKFSDVAKLTPLRPLVRRPTGGGIVPHDSDWTYSLIFPPGDPWHELSARESYCRVHEWIRDAFGKINVVTEVAPTARRALPGQCFEGHEQFDLLWKGRKVAGAAQRRNRHGLLIQGSVQPPLSVGKAVWQKGMCDIAHLQWSVDWQSFEPVTELSLRATRLMNAKFATDAFLKKR